jgi:hypothetical protein
VEIKVLTGSISKEDHSIQTVAFSIINEADKKKSFDQAISEFFTIRISGTLLNSVYWVSNCSFLEAAIA